MISVIVPIYNTEKFLSRCLNSIMKQTYTNFEVLLIDDGSKDNSEKVCQAFVSKDSRFKYFYKHNGGLSDARNYGLKFAKGEYIAFIDSDDFINYDYLSYLYQAIISNEADIAVCSFYEVNELGKKLRKKSVDFKENIDFSGKQVVYKNICDSYNVTNVVAWNKLYRKTIFDRINYPVNRLFEDEFVFVPLFWYVKKVCFVNKALYYYVQREGSIVRSKFNKKKLIDNLIYRQERINFFKTRNNKVYKCTISEMKSYIINVFKFENIDNEYQKKLQTKYRQLCWKDKFIFRKQFMRDCLAYISLKKFAKLYNFLRITK